MARPLRVVRAGGWHHVFTRGVSRRVIYGDDRDRRHFLELLEDFVQRYGVVVHAYVLMDTHYHLVVETPEPNLSRAMQWLNLSYAAWFNVRHACNGPVFQRPFRNVPVEDGGWAYGLSVYVHLNPLRLAAFRLTKPQRKAESAGVSKPLSPEQVRERLRRLRTYPWSSYRAYAGYASAPVWLTTGALLSRASRKAGEQTRVYRRQVQDRLRQGVEASSGEAFRDALAIGSAAFAQRVKALGKAAGLGRETVGKRQVAARVRLEAIVRAVEQVKGEPWDSFCARYGDPGAALVMRLARRYTGLTLREIGAAVGGLDYAAVSMAIKRQQQRVPRDAALAEQERAAIQLLNVEMSP